MARKREQLTITLPQDLIEWMDEQIDRRRFANKSHAIELALFELKKRDTQKQ